MRRVATRVLSSKPALACEQSCRRTSSRWTNPLSASNPRYSIGLPPPHFHRRTLHFTASRLLQQEATTHPAPSSTPPQPSAQRPADQSDSTSSASSVSSTQSSSTPQSAADAPISVTAVATPLSRSAATAAAWDSSSKPPSSSSSSPSPLRLLRVPDLELGDAKLSKWLVQPHTHFSTDCVLCELDTDMAVIEYKADRPGWLAMHTVEEGDEVHVDQPIAVACEKEEEVARVRKEWLDKVERKEREREQRAEQPAHSLSEEVAKMKE